MLRIILPNCVQDYTKSATKIFEHGIDPPPDLNNVKKNRRFGSGGRPLVLTPVLSSHSYSHLHFFAHPPPQHLFPIVLNKQHLDKTLPPLCARIVRLRLPLTFPDISRH